MYLSEPAPDDAVRALYQDDLSSYGYVMNLTRLWARRPELLQGYLDVRAAAMADSGLTDREIALLVVVSASTRHDSYCSLAWGARLADRADTDTAAAVLGGDTARLPEREAALAEWAAKVAGDPNGTTAADVDRLREVGFDDAQILGATVFIALRMAFSTINGALGAQPDHQLAEAAPASVLGAIDFGRPVAEK
ncbi:carboxymuconolactone decarboxylase family protein [Microlunatus speluncae]|uniref:carboxymuconolactone decarboxylase family protein n=1 Tax=Microlunatus speluncae TaxID=2594267 RepID=UPI0012665BB7|nr:hypothetical protein [Microlunatus speluncae]